MKPTDITEQKWPSDNQPLVSIICNTYNHENFIGKAIDGFLMQRTTFPVEILIHDDASTDNTALIVKEYELKHPELIKPIYQKINQYSQGIKPRTFQLPRARGKYIALCEGDDYWTDPLKLQKQVEFLEGNEEYVICYHDSEVVDQDGQLIKESKLNKTYKRDASSDDLKKGFKVLTQTMCYRNIATPMPPEAFFGFGGDKFRTSILGAYGKGKYMNNVKKSRFRVHPGGINRGVKDPKQKKINFLKTRIALFLYYERLGDSQIRDYFLEEIARLSNVATIKKTGVIKMFIPPIIFSIFKLFRRNK